MDGWFRWSGFLLGFGLSFSGALAVSFREGIFPHLYLSAITESQMLQQLLPYHSIRRLERARAAKLLRLPEKKVLGKEWNIGHEI